MISAGILGPLPTPDGPGPGPAPPLASALCPQPSPSLRPILFRRTLAVPAEDALELKSQLTGTHTRLPGARCLPKNHGLPGEGSWARLSSPPLKGAGPVRRASLIPPCPLREGRTRTASTGQRGASGMGALTLQSSPSLCTLLGGCGILPLIEIQALPEGEGWTRSNTEGASAHLQPGNLDPLPSRRRGLAEAPAVFVRRTEARCGQQSLGGAPARWAPGRVWLGASAGVCAAGRVLLQPWSWCRRTLQKGRPSVARIRPRQWMRLTPLCPPFLPGGWRGPGDLGGRLVKGDAPLVASHFGAPFFLSGSIESAAFPLTEKLANSSVRGALVSPSRWACALGPPSSPLQTRLPSRALTERPETAGPWRRVARPGLPALSSPGAGTAAQDRENKLAGDAPEALPEAPTEGDAERR